MKNQSVLRDERTTVIENASYRWAYLLLALGLLADIAFRGLVANQENNWDLTILVLLSGLIATSYQAIHRVLTRRWAIVAALAVIAGLGIAWATTLFHLTYAPIVVIVIAGLIGIAYKKYTS